MKKVADIMTRSVDSLTPETSVRDAADRMKTRNIGSLPVCENNQLVGTLTDRDVTIRVTAEGRDPEKTKVGEIMSKEMVTCLPEQDISEAEQLMHDHQVRRLPVVDESRTLVGYLSMAKIAQAEQDEKITGKVIRGISEPKKPAPRKIATTGSRGRTGTGGA
jgi:CBS domain-containing protein